MSCPASAAGPEQPPERPDRHAAHQRRRVVKQAAARPERAPASPLLPMAISTLRTKRSRPMRLIGEPENSARNAASSSAASSASAGRVEVRPRLQLRLARGLRELVPRADGEAVVAAIDPVAHRRAELAPGSARHARWSGRRCSAAHRAGRAPGRRRSGRCRGSAGRRRNGRSRRRRAPRSRSVRISPRNSQEPNRRDTRLVCLPCQPMPGRLRQRLFQQRCGVDEHLHLGAEPAVHPAGQLLQPALEQLVIVAVAGIDRDGGPRARRQRSPADRCRGRS